MLGMDNYKRRLVAIRKARKKEMAALLNRGWTLQRVADHYGLTRQRIHQIVAGKYGAD